MPRPHAHHILFKKGIGREQQALVDEGFKILDKYKINPLEDRRNLVWVPNITGQHTIGMLGEALKDLRRADKLGTEEAITRALKTAGERANRLR